MLTSFDSARRSRSSRDGKTAFGLRSAATPAPKSLEFVQVTPQISNNHFSSYEVGDTRIHRLRFGHGVQLKELPSSRGPLIGLISHREAKVTLSGQAWALPELALVRKGGTLDLWTLGPSEFIWIDAGSRLAELCEAKGCGQQTMLATDGERSGLIREACDLSATGATLLSLLQNALRSSSPRNDRSTRTEPTAFVRRAEDFMWEHL